MEEELPELIEDDTNVDHDDGGDLRDPDDWDSDDWDPDDWEGSTSGSLAMTNNPLQKERTVSMRCHHHLVIVSSTAQVPLTSSLGHVLLHAR